MKGWSFPQFGKRPGIRLLSVVNKHGERDGTAGSVRKRNTATLGEITGDSGRRIFTDWVRIDEEL